MTTDAAHGTMSAQRTIRRPGKAAFRSAASPSEMRMVTPTTTTTQVMVRMRMLGRSGLAKRCSKFCEAGEAPADPGHADVQDRGPQHLDGRPEDDPEDEQEGGADPGQRAEAGKAPPRPACGRGGRQTFLGRGHVSHASTPWNGGGDPGLPAGIPACWSRPGRGTSRYSSVAAAWIWSRTCCLSVPDSAVPMVLLDGCLHGRPGGLVARVEDGGGQDLDEGRQRGV